MKTRKAYYCGMCGGACSPEENKSGVCDLCNPPKPQQTSVASHTPTPEEVAFAIRGASLSPESKAFIIRAVNSHEELVAVVKNLITCMNAEPHEFHSAFVAQATNALSRAKGKE